MGILSEISETRVYLDTSPFIFYVEGLDPYASVLHPLMDALDTGAIEGLTPNPVELLWYGRADVWT